MLLLQIWVSIRKNYAHLQETVAPAADIDFRIDMLIEYFTEISLKATVCHIRAKNYTNDKYQNSHSKNEIIETQPQNIDNPIIIVALSRQHNKLMAAILDGRLCRFLRRQLDSECCSFF